LVHVVWIDYRGGSYRVYYKHSEDGGKTWGTDVDLCDVADFLPTLALSGAPDVSVHLLYQGDMAGSNAPFYKVSRDGGATWATPVLVGSTGTTTTFLSVSACDNRVYACWQGGAEDKCEPWWNCSRDNGRTWEEEKVLTVGTTDYFLEAPVLVTSGWDIAVIHQGRYRRETYVPDALYFKYSLDGGNSWTEKENIGTLSDANFDYNLFFDTEQHLWLVQDAYDAVGDHLTILVRTLDHLGGEWSEPLDLLGDYGISEHMSPVGVCNNDTVHIFWRCVTNVGPEWEERPMIAYRRYVPRWKEQEEQNKYLFVNIPRQKKDLKIREEFEKYLP